MEQALLTAQSQLDAWLDAYGLTLAQAVAADPAFIAAKCTDWEQAITADLSRQATLPALPRRTPGRSARIAAVHMLAAWLAEHDEEAFPERIETRHFIHESEEVDAATRIAAVESFAARHGCEVFRMDRFIWAELELASESVHGVQITHTLMAAVRNSPAFY